MRAIHPARRVATIAILLGMASLGACGKGEREGLAEAKREAEAEQKAKEKAGVPPTPIRTPVPGEAKIPCSQLVKDPAAYQTALGEKEPMTVQDKTAGQHDAAAVCGLLRGGKRPSPAEQEAILKKEPRLGVLPGDELCHVSAFCYTIEDSDSFRKRCLAQKKSFDETLGFPACVMIVAQGRDDVPLYEVFDTDTKCVLKIGGGPSNVDAASISSCAKVATETIGLEQIAVGAAPAPAASGSGSGSGG